MADREGRLEYRPKKIKAEVLPYDSCNLAKLIEQLACHGFVVLYSVNGENYLSIPAFAKHQNCHVREPESTIPAPDEHSASTVPCTSPARPLTESPLLNPESPLLNPESVEKVPVQGTDDFDSFWTAYPKKSGSKKSARENWRKLNGERPPLETILEAIQKQLAWRQRAGPGEFRPEWKDPERWIKGRMWEAEVFAGEAPIDTIEQFRRRKAAELRAQGREDEI